MFIFMLIQRLFRLPRYRKILKRLKMLGVNTSKESVKNYVFWQTVVLNSKTEDIIRFVVETKKMKALKEGPTAK